MVTVISSSTPVASAIGGGFITAGGTVVRASSTEAGFQTPTRRRGGGGGGGSIQQSFATEEDIQQSFIDQPQITPIPTPTGRTIQSQLQEQVQQDFGDTSLQTRIDQQSVVGLPRTLTEQALLLGREERRPSVRFTPELLRSSARQFFFEDGTPITAAATLASPLQGFFPRPRGEDFFIPKDLKISDELKIQTRIERQREEALADPSLLIPADVLAIRGQERISKELVGELQPLVTAGTLSIEQAEKKFEEEFLPRFEKQISAPISKRQEFISEFEKGRRPAVDVTAIAELGAIGLGSLTPTGQALIATSFVAEGLPKITGGETLLERGLGVAEVGIGLGTGGLVSKGIERSADILLVKELQAQRALLTGKEVARGEAGSLFEIRTLRQFGAENILKTEIRSPVFQTGKDTFSLTGGRGKRTLEFFSIEKGKPLIFVEDFQFGGRQRISPKAPKVIKDGLTIELQDVTGSFGTGFVQKRGSEGFREFKFGGISKDIETELGKFTQVQSGRVSGLRLEGVEPLGRGGLTFRGGVVKVPIEESGVIRRLVIPEGEGVKFLSPAKIKRTPFQTTFQELKIPAPTGLITGIERQLPSQVIKEAPIVSRSLIGIPRATGGAGLTQEQIQRGQGLVQQELVQPLLFPPVGRQDLSLGLVQPELIVQRGKQKDIFGLGTLDKIIQGEITKTRGRTLQIPETKLDQVLNIKQVTKQLQIPQQELVPQLTIPSGRTPFEPFGRGDFGLPFIPPFLPLPKERGTPRVIKRGKKVKTRIAPSFTGIVLEIETGIPETTVIGGIDIGILPGQIRGIAKRKKTKKKVSKKKTVKKKSKKKKK